MKKLILLSAFSLLFIIGFAASSYAQDNATLIKSMTHTDSPVDTSTTPFIPNGKVKFQLITDFSYKTGGDSTAVVYKPYTQQTVGTPVYQQTAKYSGLFDMRRIYFGYDYNFTRDFTGQVLLANEPAEIYSNSTEAASATGPLNLDGTDGTYVKLANVQWKNFIPYAKLTFGQQAPPTFVPTTEYLWAYRSIEKTIMDMRSIGSSTDMGIQMSGKFDSTGNLGYTAMIGNGSNKKPDFSPYKKYYASLNGFFFDRHLAVELYGDYMDQSDTTHYMTGKLFVAALFDPCSIGIEYVQQPAKGVLDKVDTNEDPTGLSVWARGQIIGKTLGYFVRYDMWNPNVDANAAVGPYYKETFGVVGLDWQPSAGLHFMPNLWIDGYSAQNGAPSKSTDVVVRMTAFANIP